MRVFFGKHSQLGWIFGSFFLIAFLTVTALLVFTQRSNSPLATREATVNPSQMVATAATIDKTPTQIEATSMPASTTETIETVPTVEPTDTELAAGDSRISEIDGMEQVYVPAGDFLMGTNDIEAKREISGGRAYPEVPQFSYFLDSYWIDKYEVTNKQYHACMDAGACTEPHRIGSYTYPDYFTNPTYENYPVIWVSWFQATAYCKWAGRRLPTEAEWEKAARGTEGLKYVWGNDPYTPDKANICDENCTRTHRLEGVDDGYPDLAPVGSYPAGASPYGASDMAGNVWEWNSTAIQPYPYNANDGREDPGGNDVERVWRGSSWANGLWWIRASTRYHALDFYSWYVLGMRCAASPD